MQKLAPLWFGVLALWAGYAVAQTQDYIIQQQSATGQSHPAAHAPVAPTGAAAAQPTRIKRIVLLLPTLSPTLGEAASVVESGIEAAAKADGGAPVALVATHDDDVADRYRDAVADGASVVIGPLTREAIAEVAPRVSVPTLALNTLGRESAGQPRLLAMSLSVESEARQVARLMLEDGRTKPLVLVGTDGISQRMARAFEDEWQRLAKSPPPEWTWNEKGTLPESLASNDAVFLAMDSAQAAAAKAALPGELGCYATSQINARTPDPRLAGVRFIDMPWFLMPTHPAVQRYEHPAATLTMQTERLYALGVDAYRVARTMATANKLPPTGWQLDGVTGDLRLMRDHQFERELPVAVVGGASQ
jgi:outer membrane PBP1 activator LpoA protein